MLLKNKRIFLVEDNLENRAIAQILLEQEGATTAIDRWGIKTLDSLKEFAPVDIIILDLQFPRYVNGFDIFKSIRTIQEFDPVPIIAVSGMDTQLAIPRAKKLGFAGFISKPVSFDLFPQQIADVMAGKEVWYNGHTQIW